MYHFRGIWAATVFTAVIRVAQMSALVTLGEVTAQGFSAAGTDICRCPQVASLAFCIKIEKSKISNASAQLLSSTIRSQKVK